MLGGWVETWDGVPLDTTVTLPRAGARGLPLVVLIPGFGNSKYEYLDPASEAYTGNAFTWARRGYAVLTYTARGLWGSCGQPEAGSPIRWPARPGTSTSPRCATRSATRRSWWDALWMRGTPTRAGSLAEDGDGWVIHPGSRRLDVGTVVALPVLEGPRIKGLPMDERGFIPIGQHSEVVGAPDLFAAGDGTNFRIKQGGLGTQQADAAAEAIAARAGADLEPQPFRPVLRGKLITGDESLNLRSDLRGGTGEGQASLDYLWSPPQKVAGRYLAPYLAGLTAMPDVEPPARTLDVEVAFPTEWHREPMALDPL